MTLLSLPPTTTRKNILLDHFAHSRPSIKALNLKKMFQKCRIMQANYEVASQKSLTAKAGSLKAQRKLKSIKYQAEFGGKM